MVKSMSSKIKGVTVILYNVVKTGSDDFGDPIYAEYPESVDNVLVAPSSDAEILDTVNLYGDKPVYTLAIPKGDTHDWEDRKVTFFGKDWRVFGSGQEGIESNIPLDWNKKVMVERYE